jgi:3-dehydro-L-gulonate 2-dehydrogenase
LNNFKLAVSKAKHMSQDQATVTVSASEMQQCFMEILCAEGFTEERASACAEIFVSNSIDGVYTHGVNRFPRFVKYVRDGFVKPAAVPERVSAFGSLEQWNGMLGPGTLNAVHATERAMELAAKNGIGCVALSNTNHWMRAGNYGWRAAKVGFVFIGWTNTIANMPAWGAVDARLGNNPLVMALPYGDEAIVLDMAMSQYSLGHMEMAAMKHEKLPVKAGFDETGMLTDDPASILATRRLLPTGYWKGSGLALLLDLLSTVLSGGMSTQTISKENVEYGLSQVFIAISLSQLPNHSAISGTVKNIIADYLGSIPQDDRKKVSFPGERVLRIRKENSIHGIPVQRKVWDLVRSIHDGGNDLSGIRYT